MLSKLLKYEFRATGRIMLPVYALLLVTAGGTSVTGSLMGRYPESTVLSIFRTLFMTLFAFTTFGVLLLTLVLMVYRFYKNLMTDEGYLMFTLPVSRSQLIWSKLIVSMAWGILSAVLAALDGSTPVLAAVKPKDTDFLRRVRQHPHGEVFNITPESREALYHRLRSRILQWNKEEL